MNVYLQEENMRIVVGITCLLLPIAVLLVMFTGPIYWPNYGVFYDNVLLFITVLTILLIVGFSWYSLKSGVVPVDKRKLWVVVLLFANIYALPFFWYWYVHKKRI